MFEVPAVIGFREKAATAHSLSAGKKRKNNETNDKKCSTAFIRNSRNGLGLQCERATNEQTNERSDRRPNRALHIQILKSIRLEPARQANVDRQVIPRLDAFCFSDFFLAFFSLCKYRTRRQRRYQQSLSGDRQYTKYKRSNWLHGRRHHHNRLCLSAPTSRNCREFI